jgi:ATP-dependent Lhr-like helicase
LKELVRGRLIGMGSVTANSLAGILGIELTDINGALLALESEGFVMRGRYMPGERVTEWCE